MNKLIITGILLLGVVTMTGQIGFCQEEAEVPAVVEEKEALNYTYGSVVKISDQQLTLNEYDFDSDAMKEISYTIDPSVELNNIKAITDLVAGDNVDVYFVEKDGVKVVKIIGKEETPEEEGEIADEETNQEDEAVEEVPVADAVVMNEALPVANAVVANEMVPAAKEEMPADATLQTNMVK